ncbi:hypothetical protein A7K91_02335 [Paenibacillus oryzae]|uniref:Uncharacterized protein n=1 Tax=Paenibacillus oryzae TaxID=1844972 RepID=A0A1A5YA15_9BACL|nr:hypothetical protein A7K91_02335 [Paenibacillus oryzae]
MALRAGLLRGGSLNGVACWVIAWRIAEWYFGAGLQFAGMMVICDRYSGNWAGSFLVTVTCVL